MYSVPYIMCTCEVYMFCTFNFTVYVQSFARVKVQATVALSSIVAGSTVSHACVCVCAHTSMYVYVCV